jgi:hypothetical protein
MSKFQYIGFRAIDRAVSADNLEFMNEQSSRAEITPWSFDNEYHYGDFRGDAHAMLRRGYDIHLHYSNFGHRSLLIRLPHGLPDAKAAQPYLGKEAITLIKDKSGPGCILAVEPSFEPDSRDELWDVDEILDNLAGIRNEIMAGDLRPLYLAHLALCLDDYHDPETTIEGPVPAGLNQLTDAQQALAEFYGLSDGIIAAAAEAGPKLPKKQQIDALYQAWLTTQPEAERNEWLLAWMLDPMSAVRADVIAKFRADSGAQSWPTANAGRTIEDLETNGERLERELEKKAAAAEAKERAKRLAKMVADPNATLRQTEKLVAKRTSEAYAEVAELLFDLREALTPTGKGAIAEQHAVKLKEENPTLKLLVRSLREKGFLAKGKKTKR